MFYKLYRIEDCGWRIADLFDGGLRNVDCGLRIEDLFDCGLRIGDCGLEKGNRKQHIMILDKYINRIEFASYEEFKAEFKIKIPDNFNFAYDVVDEIAIKTPGKIAMVWCDDKGNEAIFTFGRTLSDQLQGRQL